MNIAHIIETGLIILAAFLVGAIVGYVIRCMFFRPQKSAVTAKTSANIAAKTPATPKPASKPEPAPQAQKPAAEKPAPKPAPAKKATPNADADGKPIPLSGPRDGKKDDLKRIKGIGPKIETTLNELGIYHFDQIAGWSSKTVSWINSFLSFKGRIQREKWISQAKALASGKETKFSKRVDSGKVPSSKK
ncbi:MAG TPA: NADH:ubiquinone oxidoreductase [Devosia sp.]|nr:NADH:ubiquinone oxidoreductase [Devosia sp.]